MMRTAIGLAIGAISAALLGACEDGRWGDERDLSSREEGAGGVDVAAAPEIDRYERRVEKARQELRAIEQRGVQSDETTDLREQLDDVQESLDEARADADREQLEDVESSLVEVERELSSLRGGTSPPQPGAGQGS